MCNLIVHKLDDAFLTKKKDLRMHLIGAFRILSYFRKKVDWDEIGLKKITWPHFKAIVDARQKFWMVLLPVLHGRTSYRNLIHQTEQENIVCK